MMVYMVYTYTIIIPQQKNKKHQLLVLFWHFWHAENNESAGLSLAEKHPRFKH